MAVTLGGRARGAKHRLGRAVQEESTSYGHQVEHVNVAYGVRSNRAKREARGVQWEEKT